MAYGLQVFDSSGNLEIDVSSRLARLIGVLNINLNKPGFYAISYSSTNYAFTGIADNGNWFISGLPDKCSAKIFNGYITLYVHPKTVANTATIQVYKL